MKNMGGLIGWFALTATLAVPALLFYNWWSKMNVAKKDQAQESSFQVKTPIFEKSEDAMLSSAQQGTSAKQSRVELGGASRPSAASQLPSVAALPRDNAGAEGSPSPSKAIIIGFDISSRPLPTKAKGSLRAPQQEAAPLTTAASSQAKVAFSPKVDRDPTLSLEDRDWLRAEEARRRIVPEEVKTPVKRKKRPEEMVVLQGIIETERGIQAIINGGAYKQGSFIRGIRVVKIRAESVVFDYKGRRFVKRISQ